MGDGKGNGNGGHFSRAGVSWPMLILIASFSTSIGGLAFWLGQESGRIAANSNRLDRIEVHDADTRDREAKITVDSVQRDGEVNARLTAVEALLKSLMSGNHK